MTESAVCSFFLVSVVVYGDILRYLLLVSLQVRQKKSAGWECPTEVFLQ